MKALVAFCFIILSAASSQAGLAKSWGIICSTKDPNIHVGLATALFSKLAIFVSNETNPAPLESYIVTKQLPGRVFEAKASDYYAKIDFVTKSLFVNLKDANGKITKREFEMSHCHKQGKTESL